MKKTILGLFLVIAVVFTVSAQQYTEERYFKTEPAGSGVRIIGYTGTGGAVNIPPTIRGQRVISIGDEAFRAKRREACRENCRGACLSQVNEPGVTDRVLSFCIAYCHQTQCSW